MPDTGKPQEAPMTASRNRQEDWKRCCALAMGSEWARLGFEWVDQFQEEEICNKRDEDRFRPAQQAINLLDRAEPMKEASGDEKTTDQWTENALRIQRDLKQIALWISSKKSEYLYLEMNQDETMLIESTVASFARTAAKELEALEKAIPSPRSNLARHQAGIAKILWLQLQEQITQPFEVLQMQRNRLQYQLLQRGFYEHKPDADNSETTLKLFDDATEEDPRFSSWYQTRQKNSDVIPDFIEKKHRPTGISEKSKFSSSKLQKGREGSSKDDPGLGDSSVRARDFSAHPIFILPVVMLPFKSGKDYSQRVDDDSVNSKQHEESKWSISDDSVMEEYWQQLESPLDNNARWPDTRLFFLAIIAGLVAIGTVGQTMVPLLVARIPYHR